MKNKLLAIAFLSVAPQVFSQADNELYEPVEFGGTNYGIECKWFDYRWIDRCTIDGSGFFVDAAKQPEQFFVAEGNLYVNHVTYDGRHKFLVIDGTSGEVIGSAPLDMSVIPNTMSATAYAGNDSEGTPYVASCAMFGNPDFPMALTTVKVDGGKLSAGVHIELPVMRGLSGVTQAPAVYGDIEAGDFVVACPVWPDFDLDKDKALATKLAVWEVAGGDAKMYIYDLQLSVCESLPIGDNLILLYDSGVFPSASTPVFPTIYRYGGNALEPVGRLDAQALFHDTGGNGIAVAGLAGDPVMIYASGGNPATYALVAVPDISEGFGQARSLWHLAGGGSFAEARPDMITNRTTVRAVSIDNDLADIYMLSHGTGLASYRLTAEGMTTGIDDVPADDVPAEYFTPSGIAVAAPSSPGIYIVRRNGRSSKIVIR